MKGTPPAQRARHLEKILKATYDPYGEADNVTDMLTDLRHLCLSKDWDFFQCDRRARDHAACEQFANSINAELKRNR